MIRIGAIVVILASAITACSGGQAAKPLFEVTSIRPLFVIPPLKVETLTRMPFALVAAKTEIVPELLMPPAKVPL